jgi:hypothetical protein
MQHAHGKIQYNKILIGDWLQKCASSPPPPLVATPLQAASPTLSLTHAWRCGCGCGCVRVYVVLVHMTTQPGG